MLVSVRETMDRHMVVGQDPESMIITTITTTFMVSLIMAKLIVQPRRNYNTKAPFVLMQVAYQIIPQLRVALVIALLTSVAELR